MRASRGGGDARFRRLVGEPCEFELGDRALLGLEGDRRGEQPAVELGQHHLHGEIGLRQAPRRTLPRVPVGARKHELQHRHAGGFQRRRRVVEAGGKGGGVENYVGLPLAKRRRDKGGRVAILQAAHIERADVEALRVERSCQSLDGGEIGGEQIGAIEQDHGKRPPRYLRHLEPMHAMHGDRLREEAMVGGEPRQMRHEPERPAHVLGAAGREMTIEPGEYRHRHGGKLGKPRILAAIARQKRQGNAGRAGGVSQFLGAVAPIIEPAEQTHDRATCSRDHLLDIEVDRHGVAEPGEIGEAQGGELPIMRSPSSSGGA